MTSGNAEHGIGHSFGWQHRVIRIGEMLEDFINWNKKINARDMMKIAGDTLDIQARATLPSMLKTIEKGKSILSQEDLHRIKFAQNVFKKWDYRFSKDSVAASIYTSYEF